MKRKGTSNAVKMIVAQQLMRLSAGKTTTATVAGNRPETTLPLGGGAKQRDKVCRSEQGRPSNNNRTIKSEINKR